MFLKIVKFISSVFALMFIGIAFVIYLTAGDLLLDYLMSEMGFNIKYSNSISLIDAVIHRNVTLYDLELILKGQPVTIKSNVTHLEFDYSELFLRNGVELECILYNPELNIRHKEDANKLFTFLPSSLSPITDELNKTKFDKVYCTIFLANQKVEIKQFQMFSKEIIVSIYGEISETGKNDVSFKVFVSDNLFLKMPKETVDFFESTKGSWKSFKLHIITDARKGHVKVENPRLRLEIGSEISN